MLQKKLSSTSPLIKAITDENWDYAIKIVHAHPSHTKKLVVVSMENSKTKMLPLHRACCRNPSVFALNALLHSYPKAVYKTDSSFNRLPLHFSCIKSANEDVVRALLRAFPEGAHRIALNGRLPLHYACANGSSLGVINALIEYYPEGTRIADKFGMLPIHLACLRNAPVAVTKGLLKAFPESIHFKTKMGTSLLACTHTINDCENKRAIISLLDSVPKKSTPRAVLSASVRGPDEKPFKPFTLATKKVESGEFC